MSLDLAIRGFDWWHAAACEGMGADLFFPDVTETDYAARRAPDVAPVERAAVAVCGTCDVRSACLEWALAHEDYGVWGGLTAVQRRRLRGNAGAPDRSGRTLAMRVSSMLARGWDPELVAAELGLPSVDAVHRLAMPEPAA